MSEVSGARLLRGGLWSLVAQFLPQIFAFVISVMAARYLGVYDMGRQSYLSFIGVTVSVLLPLGLPLTVQRYISLTIGQGRPGLARSVLVWAVRWGVLLAVVGAVVVLVFGRFAFPELKAAWTLCAVWTMLMILHSVVAQALVGMQRWFLSSAFGVGSGFVTTALAAFALSQGYGIEGMFAAECIGALLSVICTWVVGWVQIIRIAHVPLPIKEIRQAMLGFTALVSATVVLEVLLERRSEFFLLQAWSTPEQLAIYSIAFAAIAAAAGLPYALVVVVLPAVASAHGAGERDRIVNGTARALRLSVILTVPTAIAVSLFGAPAVVLVYGQQYAEVGDLLMILAPVIILMGPVAAIGAAVFQGLGRPKTPIACSAAGLLVNIVLAVVLIGSHGAMGAAVASGVGQAVTSVAMLWATRRLLGVRWWHRIVWRSVVCSIVLGAILAVALVGYGRSGSYAVLVGGGVLGVAGYLLAAWRLKVLSVADSTWLVDALGARLALAGRIVQAVSEPARPIDAAAAGTGPGPAGPPGRP